MFYHTYILTKRGPFAKIWLAAHWDKKLSKNDVKLIDLNNAVLNIIEPVVPISLRTSGELMLGVVRVYGHKVRILLKESQDAAHEATRHKEVHTHIVGTKAKNAVTNETISAVTNTDPIEKPVATGKGFDAEFAAIADIVMDTNGTADAAKPFESEQAMINKWFNTGANTLGGAGHYNPAETFMDFRREINREFFPNREDSMSISDKSKHSNSSGSSIEELRRSTAPPPSAEKRRYNIDIGLPAGEEHDIPELPEMDTAFPAPDFMAAHQEGDAQPFQAEPPRKKRVILKQSLVDEGETVISADVYRKHMRDRSDLLSSYYRQSVASFPGEKHFYVDSKDMLGEATKWEAFAPFFAEQLKAKTIDLKPAETRMEAPTAAHDVPFDEEPLPEYGSNFSPTRPSGFGDADVAFDSAPWHGQVPENSAAAFLESLKSAASSTGTVAFDDMLRNMAKGAVAHRFGDLLALASLGDVRVEQKEAFGMIQVSV